MIIKKKEAERLFDKLKVKRKNSTHHITGWFLIDGKRTLPLHFSKGRGDMSERTSNKFRKLFLVNENNFKELLRCKVSKDQYTQLILSILDV